MQRDRQTRNTHTQPEKQTKRQDIQIGIRTRDKPHQTEIHEETKTTRQTETTSQAKRQRERQRDRQTKYKQTETARQTGATLIHVDRERQAAETRQARKQARRHR